eukprot:scaffold558_cov111-Cylindrotheca_fusiformis.AAC.4
MYEQTKDQLSERSMPAKQWYCRRHISDKQHTFSSGTRFHWGSSGHFSLFQRGRRRRDSELFQKCLEEYLSCQHLAHIAGHLVERSDEANREIHDFVLSRSSIPTALTLEWFYDRYHDTDRGQANSKTSKIRNTRLASAQSLDRIENTILVKGAGQLWCFSSFFHCCSFSITPNRLQCTLDYSSFSGPTNERTKDNTMMSLVSNRIQQGVMLHPPPLCLNTVVYTRRLASKASTTTPPPVHQLNINLAVVKKEEGQSFNELVTHPVTTLQGIGPKHSEQLESLGIKTIQKLADYKFFHLAKAIQTLSDAEEENSRMEGSAMNLNKGLDKAFEHYSLQELLQQPVYALNGLTPAAGETFQMLGVKTIAELAEFKYCKWAEAIVTAARFEEEQK